MGKLLVETDVGFNVNADRLERLQQRCRSLLDVSRMKKAPRSERHPFFALLFSSRCLDSMRFWNCTFQTDGYSVRLAVLDIRKPLIVGQFRTALLARHYIIDEAAGTVTKPSGGPATPLDIFEEYMRKFPNKAGRPDLERDLDTSAFDTVKSYDKGQRKCLFLRELHPVENVYQRLHRQQEEAPGDTTLRPLFAAPSTRTKDGLPASTRKLGSQTSESVLDGLRSLYLSRNPNARVEVQGWSSLQLLQNCIVVGFDPGEYNPFAGASTDRVGDKIQTLFMHYHAVENSRQAAQKASQRARARYFDGASEQVNKAERDFRNGKAQGRIDFDGKTGRHALYQRLTQQMAETLWPKCFNNGRLVRRPRDLKQPALFAIGDGCGMSKKGAGVKHVDASMPLMRAVIHNLTQRGFPILCVWVGEAYSSQCCPDPACLRPAVPNFREAAVQWKTEQAAQVAAGEPAGDVPADFVRSRWVYD
jgi:hypothetical protein